MNRRLVAALACRNQSSRLFGKPVQNLDIDKGIRIIDNIIDCLRSIHCIEEVVLGIAEGLENEIFQVIAKEKGLRYIVGSESDVLSRLIDCGELANASDIFRTTSESPFLYFEPVDDLWRIHKAQKADATFMDQVIDGVGCEIINLNSLRLAHSMGNSKHREHCSLYIREHSEEFKVVKPSVPRELIRKDLRLTVDYPQDLVVCRAIYQAFATSAPRISVPEIIKFLDGNPGLIELISPFVEEGYASMYI